MKKKRKYKKRPGESCNHLFENISSSNCSICKIKMMSMPKKVIINYKSKDQHIDWTN